MIEGNGSGVGHGVEVTVKSMVDVGAHYGHQTQKWNPKMGRYIYAARNGIHIINLDRTLELYNRARKFVLDQVSGGATILFVGTKLQTREIIKEEATRCGAFHVTSRWLGGTLSNFQTIKNSIDRMKRLEDFLRKSEDESTGIKISKKEKLSIGKQLEKLSGTLGGIRDMKDVPDIIFIVDISKDEIAVAEAKKLQIPVVALVDTNVDPDPVNYPIPSNDDAVRTLRLFTAAIADAVLEGKAVFASRGSKDKDREPAAAKEGAAEKSAPIQ